MLLRRRIPHPIYAVTPFTTKGGAVIGLVARIDHSQSRLTTIRIEILYFIIFTYGEKARLQLVIIFAVFSWYGLLIVSDIQCDFLFLPSQSNCGHEILLLICLLLRFSRR